MVLVGFRYSESRLVSSKFLYVPLVPLMPNFDDASFSFFHLQPDLDSQLSQVFHCLALPLESWQIFFLLVYFIFFIASINKWWQLMMKFKFHVSQFFCFNNFFCSAFEKSLRARLVKVIIPTVKIHFWTQQYCSLNKFFFLSKSDKPRHWLPLHKIIWFMLQTGYPNTCCNILLIFVSLW